MPDLTKRHTTRRRHHRRILAQGEPPCSLCGEPINYELRYPDKDSFVVDHIIPFAISRDDSLANKQPAHSGCNRLKSDNHPTLNPGKQKPAEDTTNPWAAGLRDLPPGVTFITARTW